MRRALRGLLCNCNDALHTLDALLFQGLQYIYVFLETRAADN